MSLVLIGLQAATAAFRTSFINRAVSVRYVCRGTALFSEDNEESADQGNVDERQIPPAKDRRNLIPVETSIRYLVSDAYKETYGKNPVWKLYRRNHKGLIPPKKTRRTCIRSGIISTGNPCPICRDEYLIIDHRNIGLLNQFISEYNGEILSYTKTGICQNQYKKLLIAIYRAKDYGTITFDVPFREYDYSDWYKGETEATQLPNPKEKKENPDKKTMSEFSIQIPFVIIGGGIAGVSCAESLAFLAPATEVLLITASPLVKAVTNIVPLATTLMQFDVEERQASALTEAHPSIKVIQDTVVKVNLPEKSIETQSGNVIRYNKLCVCTGARPRLIYENNERVIGIRDTESVENLSRRIEKARRIIVVGNGGIATELVHQVEGVEVIWVIRDKHISATFVDPGAAEFFQDKLLNRESKASDSGKRVEEVKRIKYTITEGAESKEGPALGPDWHNAFAIKGASTSSLSNRVTVEYQCEVSSILEPSSIAETAKSPVDDWPIYAKLTNGKLVGCDIIISATGVEPNSKLSGLEGLRKAEDGGFSVDWQMETSEKDVYAAGDVCTACWDIAEHWFQMRLWTQAHQMGRYAAKSMFSSLNNEEFNQDFCFDLFTHVTNFFGYKVVLLGLYNGQKLNRDYEILLRMTKGHEYIKLVLRNGRMQGAVLIGDTDLEEMCENLILNQLDLSIYGSDLLDPNIDIEDYFD